MTIEWIVAFMIMMCVAGGMVFFNIIDRPDSKLLNLSRLVKEGENLNAFAIAKILKKKYPPFSKCRKAVILVEKASAWGVMSEKFYNASQHFGRDWGKALDGFTEVVDFFESNIGSFQLENHKIAAIYEELDNMMRNMGENIILKEADIDDCYREMRRKILVMASKQFSDELDRNVVAAALNSKLARTIARGLIA